MSTTYWRTQCSTGEDLSCADPGCPVHGSDDDPMDVDNEPCVVIATPLEEYL